MTDNIREAWLSKAIERFKSTTFKHAGYEIPKLKVSVGLPSGRGGKLKAIGQHWSPQSSDDNIGSVFISPTIDDGRVVLATLVHEMVHASVGNDKRHGPVFRKCALAVGLEGKMTATTASDWLLMEIDKVILELGAYPHRKLNLKLNPTKKQTTRMIKMTCVSCGYIARASMTNIETFGPLICPCNREDMEVKR